MADRLEEILRQSLQVQEQAHRDFVKQHGLVQPDSKPHSEDNMVDPPSKVSDGLTMTVIGCGTMGIAILGGIMDSLSNRHVQDHISLQKASAKSGTSTPAEAEEPPKLPTKFNACVRRHESARRIKKELAKYNANLTIYENENLKPVQEADLILLSCKPQMCSDILNAEGMKAAVKGKLIMSICAGVTEAQLHNILYESETTPPECTIVRTMPNTAAAVRESMTVIGVNPKAPLDHATHTLVTWIFTRIGRVVHLPPSNMDASTALCGSGPAFVALMCESLAAGGVAMGLPREEAYQMAAQMMRGTTGLMLEQGEHPAILRDKVSTPGGCTIGGLLVLEEGGVRGAVARAVREATVVASQLGQGKTGVNGTWGR
ncbi:pyrroline-5-carboxylate reductase [Polychaeton citri CBS 116435]|uniref:Pyrroline-5-carboxylate reductase n=1 Tax=Polychaeton citri CBS 116435 TaxID=1314669 RepID=A0A9P4UUP2_9PEZI|nr:pyrroline-5-carboxylate reductase [Polychaeton citri CBS 116435]